MIRKVLFAGLALAALAVPSARASSVTVALSQGANVNAGTPIGSFGIGLSDQNDVSDGSALQQTSTANGYSYICNPTCVVNQYPVQAIPDDAFQSDLLGNTITINACLVPQSGPPCHTFALTLARPGALQRGDTEDPWVDPAGPAARVLAGVYLSRGQYVVTGTADGLTLPSVNSYAMTNWYELVSADVMAE